MFKRRRRKIITSPAIWTTPTPERCHQNGGVICESLPNTARHGHHITRYRAVWECPLDAYRAYGILNQAEYRAGLRFYRAYFGVVLCRREDFYSPVSRELASIEPASIDTQLKTARKIIAPQDLRAVINICGHSWPAQYQRDLVSLKRGLGELASRWNLAASEVCAPRKRLH
jgi:hypothetical protein